MENKERNCISEEYVHEYVGMQKDNYMFEQQLNNEKTQLINELGKYDFTLEPQKHKIPITKRAKWSMSRFLNKLTNVFGQ